MHRFLLQFPAHRFEKASFSQACDAAYEDEEPGHAGSSTATTRSVQWHLKANTSQRSTRTCSNEKLVVSVGSVIGSTSIRSVVSTSGTIVSVVAISISVDSPKSKMRCARVVIINGVVNFQRRCEKSREYRHFHALVVDDVRGRWGDLTGWQSTCKNRWTNSVTAHACGLTKVDVSHCRK